MTNRNDIEQPRVVSLYVTDYGTNIVLFSDKDICGDCARVSEPMTVTFKARPAGDIVASQVSAIDAEINEARDRFAKTLAELQERRQNLLALTAPSDGPTFQQDSDV